VHQLQLCASGGAAACGHEAQSCLEIQGSKVERVLGLSSKHYGSQQTPTTVLPRPGDMSIPVCACKLTKLPGLQFGLYILLVLHSMTSMQQQHKHDNNNTRLYSQSSSRHICVQYCTPASAENRCTQQMHCSLEADVGRIVLTAKSKSRVAFRGTDRLGATFRDGHMRGCCCWWWCCCCCHWLLSACLSRKSCIVVDYVERDSVEIAKSYVLMQQQLLCCRHRRKCLS